MAEHDETFDAKLQDMVRDAYGQVTLPEDSFARMLANLEQAADERVATNDVVEIPVAKRKPRVLRFALPVAACLLVALVAGVVAFSAPMASNYTSVSTEAVSEGDTAGGEDSDASMLHEDVESETDYSMAEGDVAAESSFDSYDADADKASTDDASAYGDNAADMEAAPLGAGNAADTQVGASYAAQFPRIELASGQTLQLVRGKDGTPQEVDESEALQYLEDAKAYAPGSSVPAPCAIYVTDDGSYAASFDGDPGFYLLEAG
ncbi:MAG: hypothetical protein J5804_04385 [Eggerthellaceae bacterium]|nr:hypothetical protein [Eggerthellaceae bacterium]